MRVADKNAGMGEPTHTKGGRTKEIIWTWEWIQVE